LLLLQLIFLKYSYSGMFHLPKFSTHQFYNYYYENCTLGHIIYRCKISGGGPALLPSADSKEFLMCFYLNFSGERWNGTQNISFSTVATKAIYESVFHCLWLPIKLYSVDKETGVAQKFLPYIREVIDLNHLCCSPHSSLVNSEINLDNPMGTSFKTI
jgi:hypothetical protein